MKNILLGIIAINLTLIPLEIYSDEPTDTVIGDIAMTEANHSEAFNQMKKMLGIWEGKLTQYTGSVIDTYSEFRLVSGGNTITEKIIEVFFFDESFCLDMSESSLDSLDNTRKNALNAAKAAKRYPQTAQNEIGRAHV